VVERPNWFVPVAIWSCELGFDGLLVAHDTNAELIVLAWSHRPGVGRARVVSETLARAEVPVLLVPTA
jgi:hypothetical protein